MYKLPINQEGVLYIDTSGAVWSIPNNPDLQMWQDYQKWLSEGNVPEPADVIVEQRKEILRSTIIERLEALDKYEEAIMLMEQPENIKLRYKWFSMNSIYVDDPDVITLLTAIGAEGVLY